MTDKERAMFVDAYKFFEKYCCVELTEADGRDIAEDIANISEKHHGEPLILDILSAVVRHIERATKERGKSI